MAERSILLAAQIKALGGPGHSSAIIIELTQRAEAAEAKATKVSDGVALLRENVGQLQSQVKELLEENKKSQARDVAIAAVLPKMAPVTTSATNAWRRELSPG